MALVKQCDRCEKHYAPYNVASSKQKTNGIITANIDMQQQYWAQTTIDLCPDCMKSFERWLKK